MTTGLLEREILGAMILYPASRAAGCDCLTAEDFSAERPLFERLAEFERAGEPTGLGALVAAGSHVEAACAIESACLPEQLRDRMRMLRRLANRRASQALIEAARQRIASGAPGDHASELAEQLQALATLDDETATLIPSLEARSGLATGLHDLDHLIGGMAAGDLVVIGARTSVGKSALALQIALAASEIGRVLYWSLEMSREALGRRALAQLSSINSRELHIAAQDSRRSRVVEAAAELQRRNLRYLTRPSLGGLRRMALIERPVLIVVDYLQLVQTTRRFDSRAQEVGWVARRLKSMASSMGFPVLACSQLNRESAKRGGKPRLSDLRESGDIEQEADIAILLHRDNEADTHAERCKATAFVAKNREGETGAVPLLYQPTLTRFVSPAREPFDDYRHD